MASSSSVPLVTSLADIYPEDALADQASRWNALYARFQSAFGDGGGPPPSFVARSPGRVNIIGEHIDYSLYSVLPMAITADAIIAVSARSRPPQPSEQQQQQNQQNQQNQQQQPVGTGPSPPSPAPAPAALPSSPPKTYKIRIANVDHARFPSREFDLDVAADDIEIDAKASEWTNYFKSGLKGALALLRKKATDAGTDFCPCDMDVVMDGTVPVGGGLSSSAAFVSASALAVMAANSHAPVDKKELTELAIVSERSVGVYSGGMDQAASVLSELGSALFVSFSPHLDAKPVRFPRTDPELAFVIAQSFVTSTKHDTAPTRYNLRVVECSLAAGYLNAVLNPPGTSLPLDAGPLQTSLRGFHDVYAASNLAGVDPEEQLQRLVTLTENTLTQEEGYTREELARVLKDSVAADLSKMAAEESLSSAAAGGPPAATAAAAAAASAAAATPSLTDADPVTNLERRYMSKFTVRADRFKIRQRALHVFGEALRVVRFLKLLENASHAPPADADLMNRTLGDLMNATQDSCRELYECSCPEIDDICRIARSAGAYGSRLTGAGWGGCTVHLVPVDKVHAVKTALEQQYYAARGLTQQQKAQAVVVSRPARGSAVLVGHAGPFTL
ncbi:galactokinase [Cordyceps javanica]|uniref:Galactokinase n=1 Tax=Cordyceps javanica TaxID=43265 RepID=A0A545UWG3_9HYPO|nr:galactokinase [Cordyceps javanica]TQW04592.1 galactokinase [Cordyceps javanica]